MPSYQFIASQAGLERYLEEIESATWIAYDTEFISEGRYQAELCLVQVATEFGDALLDPLKIPDLRPFWERLCQDGAISIAHSCRSELEFCYRALGRLPSRLFDVQLAAAFVGFDYPLNYKSLVHATIGVSLAKNETRTDWSRRPLTSGQLDYALHDVCHLKQIADFLTRKLEETGRTAWFLEETRDFCRSLEASFTDEHWQKLLGSKPFTSDEMAIVRELWRWRRRKALNRNIPPARIFRDDLIVELAKRKTGDPLRIAAVRGVNGSPDSTLVQELSAAIDDALSLPAEEKPKLSARPSYPQYALATQLLGILVNQYSARRGISPRLVSTTTDVRQAIAAREGTLPASETPRLLTGWRAKFLDDFIGDCLDGRFAMRFSNDLESLPLQLIDRQASRR